MSIQLHKKISCPKCTALNNYDWLGSLNFDRNPDLIQKVLDNTLYSISCTSCQHEYRIEPDFSCFYLTKKHWLVVHPIVLISRWPELEKLGQSTFDLAFGEKAPSSAKELGKDVRPRIVFGWPALREKILIINFGLDDVQVELAKMIIIKNEGPSAISNEYRLVEVDEENLIFDSIHLKTRKFGLEQFALLKSTLIEIEDDTEGWAKLRQIFTSGLWVDAMRSYK